VQGINRILVDERARRSRRTRPT